MPTQKESKKQVKKPSLTIKQAKLVKGIAQGKTKTQAALDAYNTTDPKTASVMAAEALGNPRVQEALQNELIKQGIDLETIIKPVAKALKAKKVVPIEGDYYETDVDDIPLQLQGHDRAAKLMNLHSRQQEQAPQLHFHKHVTEEKSQYGL